MLINQVRSFLVVLLINPIKLKYIGFVDDPDRRCFLVVLILNLVRIYPDYFIDKPTCFQAKKLISLAKMLPDSSVGTITQK